MEEKKPIRIKFKTAVILIIIVALILGICGANVYASTHGYGNVFFLIKYIITGEKLQISDRNDIFSDRDITISYESIELTENIKLQIRNLQIKDNKAKLIMVVNESKENDVTPLKYKVYNESNKLICEQNSSKDDNRLVEYTEELLLNDFSNEDKILNLEIFNSKNEKITRININLETREVTIEGEKEAIEKVSEIELKQFLGYVTSLEPCKDSDDERILFANSMLAQKEGLVVNKLDEVNKMLDATGYDRLSNPLKNAQYFKIVNKGGTNYIEVTVGRGGNEPCTILEIKEISYCGGVYTAKFKYTFIHEPDAFNMNIDELEIKEATVYFKLNEDKTYSTFKVVRFEIENTINTKEISNEEAKTILNEKYKNVEKMWLDVTKFFNTEMGKEVSNFEGIVLSYGTENFLTQVKNKLPWGIYLKNGKYYIAEGWGGDISYEGLKDFENIIITNSSITATVITKQNTYNGSDWVPDKDRKSEFRLIKNGDNWLIDYFDFAGIFENLEHTNYEQNNMSEKEKAISSIKSALLDNSWLKEHTLIKSANGNSNSIDEQEYKFAVIKEQDTQNPVVVLVVTAEKILTKNTFIIRYKNNNVSIEKVSEGHYQHTDTLTNDQYYATTYTHMKDWAYELLEVKSNDIGVLDRNKGTIEDGDYDYMDVLNFENRNNLKYVITELNDTNLNRLLNDNNNTITQISPSGFAGSSLNIVELNSNKEVYLTILSDAGDRNNIASKELIAKNVNSISKTTEGDIVVKGGDKVKSAPNWIHFEK